MISYMPFTHIEEPQWRMLSNVFGAITVYSPVATMVPGQMQRWAQQDLLDIRFPGDVDGDRVISLVREYKAWAQIHQGNIGDVVGFMKSRPERFAMMEETNPSQIRHQVRHYGDSPAQETADPLLDAALFLSLAQEFDCQQYAMDREMDAVQALERQMMEEISGDGADLERGAPIGAAAVVSSRDQSISPEMIPQRVRAWAMLALGAGDASWLYITPSRPVVEYILDLLPDGVETYSQPLGLTGDAIVLPPNQMLEMVQALNLDPNSVVPEASEGSDQPLPASQLRLTIYRFPDLAPRAFLRTLGGTDAAAEGENRQEDEPSHTLIGLVAAD